MIKRLGTIFVTSLLIMSCEYKQPPPRTSAFPEFPVSGSETWEIDEIEYAIDATKIVLVPNQEPFLAVVAPAKDLAEVQNRDLAKSLALYAKKQGYIEKAISMNVTNDGSPIVLSDDIGVSIIYREEGMISKGTGHNYLFKSTELE